MQPFERPSAGAPAPRQENAPGGVDLSEVEALRLRLELAVETAGIGGFDWDLASGEFVCDEHMLKLMGQEQATLPTVRELVQHILPADQPAVQAASQQAIRGDGEMSVDFRVTDQAGATRWVSSRARVLRDSAGVPRRMVGAVFESSRVHSDRELVAQALDTMATTYATVDPEWTVTYANQAARALLRDSSGAPIEPVGRPVWNLVPGLSAPEVVELLRGVMAGGEAHRVELYSPRADGWLEISAQPVANGIAVLVSDVTDRRRAQLEAEHESRRVRILAEAGAALARRRPVAETVELGLGLLVPQLAKTATVYLRDAPGRPLRLVGLRHEDATLEAELFDIYARLPLSNDPASVSNQAVTTGQPQIVGDHYEAVAEATMDAALRERLRAYPITGATVVPLVSRGESIGFIGVFGSEGQPPSGADLVLIEDIASRIATAIDNAQIFGQVEQAREAAEKATARLGFLASVADALGSTLDAHRAARRLTRMLVPTLADWCMVTLLDEEGGVEHVFGSHADATKQPIVDRYAQERRAYLEKDPSIIGEVVAAGQPLFRSSGEAHVQRLGAGSAAGALADLNPGALTALPILARDRTLGILSLYTSTERGELGPDDLTTAREVARRAGLVFDNARLYGRSRSRAETLQRSLLTEAVQPPGLQVATRYQPAVADSQVGGDWYDAFQIGDGSTTLVIGDVMGHDTEAAALMGQLRTLVRAIAVDRREAPAAVLERVDAAAAALRVDTTATAVLAQVVNDSGPAGGVAVLRWSNAGHPPPVLVHPDGRVDVLDTSPDLLLGLGAGFQRTDHQAELPAGSTVLLFTDGLVEGRAQPLELGMHRLALTVAPLSRLPLEELCSQLLAALVPEPGAEDDVALVAVRVLPG